MKKSILILISFSLVGVGFAQTTKPAVVKATPLKAVAAKPVTTTKAAVSKTATAARSRGALDRVQAGSSHSSRHRRS